MTAEIIPFPQRKPEITASHITFPDRLKIVKDEVGFYPHSPSEAWLAARLLRYSGTQEGAAGYLNSIAVFHQRNNQPNTIQSGAIRSQTHTMAEFAEDAANKLSQLCQYGEVFHEDNRYAGDTFGEAYLRDTWYDDPNLRALLTPVAEYVELQQFIAAPNDTIRLAETAKNERTLRIKMALGTMPVDAVAELAAEVQDSEAHRFEYWVQRLTEAWGHSYARDVAKAALEAINSR